MGTMSLFSDLKLSQRLDSAEGYSCSQFAETRGRLFPESRACWTRCAGAYLAFDGIHSPITQTFGLGLFQEVNDEVLEQIEDFFRKRNAPVQHELSPFAGIKTMDLLVSRGYRPVELSSVLYQRVCRPEAPLAPELRVRTIDASEADLWAGINLRAWTNEHPELHDFMLEIGKISGPRENRVCFLAEYNGVPGAAGALFLHEGVALFAGAATTPDLRRKGLQAALLQERMRFAFEQGCQLAAVVAEPGSNSQRNAERSGFGIAYTRTKWKLADS